LDIYEPSSYQTTKDTLRNFGNGTLSYFPNAKGNTTFFMIKTDRINGTAAYKDVNLVQSTGTHKVFVVEKDLAKKPQ
jgi:hypothetical protein